MWELSSGKWPTPGRQQCSIVINLLIHQSYRSLLLCPGSIKSHPGTTKFAQMYIWYTKAQSPAAQTIPPNVQCICLDSQQHANSVLFTLPLIMPLKIGFTNSQQRYHECLRSDVIGQPHFPGRSTFEAQIHHFIPVFSTLYDSLLILSTASTQLTTMKHTSQSSLFVRFIMPRQYKITLRHYRNLFT